MKSIDMLAAFKTTAQCWLRGEEREREEKGRVPATVLFAFVFPPVALFTAYASIVFLLLFPPLILSLSVSPCLLTVPLLS